MNNIIEITVNNWMFIVLAICIFILAISYIWKFMGYPTERKIKEIKSRLTVWIINAEKEFGSKTGEIKLSEVYEKFCSAYPYVKKWFTLEKFNSLVKDVLADVKELLKDNEIRKNALGK